MLDYSTRRSPHLHIRVDDQIKGADSVDEDSSVFESALSLCGGLIDFTYDHWVTNCSPTYPTIFPLPSSRTNHTLTNLNIRVYSFDECLRLLDGRFDSLSTYSVYVTRILMLRTADLDCTVSASRSEASTNEPFPTLETIAEAQALLADLRMLDSWLRHTRGASAGSNASCGSGHSLSDRVKDRLQSVGRRTDTPRRCRCTSTSVEAVSLQYHHLPIRQDHAYHSSEQ